MCRWWSGPDGRRLAKRHGDTRLATLREAGVRAERLVGLLAWSCGLIEQAGADSAARLVTAFELAKLPREPWVFGEEQMRWLMA